MRVWRIDDQPFIEVTLYGHLPAPIPSLSLNVFHSNRKSSPEEASLQPSSRWAAGQSDYDSRTCAIPSPGGAVQPRVTGQ